MKKEPEDLETKLCEILDLLAAAKNKLEELPEEQRAHEEWLDRAHRKVKTSSDTVEYVIWMMNNPEEDDELS